MYFEFSPPPSKVFATTMEYSEELKPGENQYISNELGVGYRMHNDNEKE